MKPQAPSIQTTALVEALPPALPPRMRIAEALAEMARFADRRCLVGSLRRPLGALGLADIDKAVRFGLGDWTLEQLVMGPVGRIRDGTGVARALKELRRSVSPLVLVVDSRGQPVGCRTREALEDGSGTAAKLLARLPPQAQDVLREVGRSSGARAWLVGGVVRDLLLGRAVEDLDVVVGGGLERVLAALGGGARAHERFGTATLDRNGLRIDVAQARRESYRRPAALPEVESGGLADDLFRRDFTANALALGLGDESWDSLFDFYGGRDDLRRRRLRVLHGLSFVEDPTRAFRAVKFAARLGFTIEPSTLRSMRLAVARGAIEWLTPARLLRELRLALSEPALVRVVSLLEQHGLLAPLRLNAGRARPALRRLPALLDRYQRLGGAPPVSQWVVALGLLLSARRNTTLSLLGPSRVEREALEEIAVQARGLARRLAAARQPSAIWRACKDLRSTTWIAALAWSGSARSARALERYVTELRGVRPAIDGDDLLRAGVAPGPAIAKGLDAARRALLDGRAPDAGSQLRIALRAAAAG